MRKNLTKEERLGGRKEIYEVFKNPERMSNCRGARLIASPKKMRVNRFAAIPVPKIGNAVKRNYEKRIFREIYRNLKYKIKNGYDIIIVAYGGAYKYFEREEQFLYLIKKAGISK